MVRSRMVVMIAVVTVVALGACGDTSTSTGSAGSVTTPLSTEMSTRSSTEMATGVSTTVVVDRTTFRDFVCPERPSAAGGGGSCISAQGPCATIEVDAEARSTCISLPGPQLLNVGGLLFVLSSYPIGLTDGRRLVPDASGMAVGVLGPSSVEGEVAHCPRAELDKAITAATDAPRTAWQITRCAPNLAAIVEFNDPEPGSSYLAYDDGRWTFVGLGSAKLACDALPEAIREACRVRDIWG